MGHLGVSRLEPTFDALNDMDVEVVFAIRE
jgi:hypothetical protein